MADERLSSWTGDAKDDIVRFVTGAVKAGSRTFVPPEDRVAVFDNDGTLWCEKPIPVELGFILGRLANAAKADATLCEQQPWKSACTRDHSWLSGAIAKHYRGDDTDVKILAGAMFKAFEGMSVERYDASARAFLGQEQHPTLKCPLREATYRPMIELLRYLEANGFATFVASGGNRDFMRAVTEDIYGIPPERVIGSSVALKYREDPQGGTIVYQAAPDVFDDGPVKPVRIWSRTGRRPLVAVGNSNGDIPMLQFAGGRYPALRILLNHDDQEREFDYQTGAERALDLASTRGWTVVSMKHDWRTVFASVPHSSAA